MLSDSGTIAEESTLLGFPAVTLRDSIERPEALDTGGIVMTGLDARDIVAAVEVAMRTPRDDGPGRLTPDDYLIDNTSERTVNFILSTARRHHLWSGIRARWEASTAASAPSQTTRRALAVWLLGGGVTLSIAANAVSIRTTIGDRVTYGVLVLIAISVIVWGLLRNPAPFQRPPPPPPAAGSSGRCESLQAPVRNGVSAMAVVTDAVIALTPGLLFFALAYWRPQRATVTQVLVAVALAATVAEMIGWALCVSLTSLVPPTAGRCAVRDHGRHSFQVRAHILRARLVAGVLVVIQAVLIVASRSRTPLVAWGVTGVVILFLQERDLRNRILRVSGAAAGVVLLVGMIFGPSRTGNIAQDFARLTRLEQFATGQQDTSLESRLAEASDVRRTMAIEGGPLTQLVGFGHGASYLPHDSLIKPNA